MKVSATPIDGDVAFSRALFRRDRDWYYKQAPNATIYYDRSDRVIGFTIYAGRHGMISSHFAFNEVQETED